MEPEITHGVDGWTLAEYEWMPDTQIGICVYERGKETRTIARRQPISSRRRN